MLEGFEPAGDAETQALPGLRFESKFVSERANLDATTRWILGHRAGFRVLHPNRQVNNIYFDTYDYRAYGDNVAGIARRIKTRLRWYGAARGTLSESNLEFKHRSNRQGWKHVFPMRDLDLNAGWGALSDAICRQLPAEQRLVFQAFPMATLLNQYRRAYYLSADGKLRLTVDHDITVFDQRNTPAPRFHPPLNMPDHFIAEFKYHHDDFPSVIDVIRDFPIRPSRSSKYVTGIKAIVEAV